jgi:hypothetical protein
LFTRDLFTTTSCNLRHEVDACNVQLYGCMSPAKIAADKANWDHLVTMPRTLLSITRQFLLAGLETDIVMFDNTYIVFLRVD